MKIDLICNDGSPLGVTEKSLWGLDHRLGVGGAELALLTLCAGWKKRGYDITLYNNPYGPDESSFPQKGIDEFDPEAERDILIIFRSPNYRSIGAKGKKVWFSCDQITASSAGTFNEFSKTVDKIVTISPYHSEYFRTIHGIFDTIPIDLPVRDDYDDLQSIQKIKNRCIFTSIPDRGVMQLCQIWPHIVEQVPDASLVITSDWRLWDPRIPEESIQRFKLSFAGISNVIYKGAINRGELLKIQMEAEFTLCPNIYEELFGISIAESQVTGAYPITSNSGALRTTNMAIVLDGDARDEKWQKDYVDIVVTMMQNPSNYITDRIVNKRKALIRFSLNSILNQWDRMIFNE